MSLVGETIMDSPVPPMHTTWEPTESREPHRNHGPDVLLTSLKR